MKYDKTMRNAKVAIVDYRMGNLLSVKRACMHVGLKPVITSDKQEIIKANAIILPGVGSFGSAVSNLEKLDLIAPIKDHVSSGKVLFGICLGMQLLFSNSEEGRCAKGLNIIDGVVSKFPSELKNKVIKVPHIGWNTIYSRNKTNWNNTPLSSIPQNEFMYFIHSFYVIPENRKSILTLTNYDGIEYCSSILNENIFATQFHPEKSGLIGIKIFQQFQYFINCSSNTREK